VFIVGGRIRTVRFETHGVCDTRTRAAACVLALGGLLLTPAAAHAGNLIANPGFETTGSGGTVFSDNLPDLSALQVTSGNIALAGGTAITAGLGSSTDAAVVRNSQDYQDGTTSVAASQSAVTPQLTGGVVVRYGDTANFYLCGITKNAVVVQRRLAGNDTVIGTASYSPAANVAYTLTATATGSSISCNAVGPGGVTATATATDASFASGMIGIAAINSTPTQVRQMSFLQPLTMTSAVPQSWTPIAAIAGRPGMVFDHIAPANSGSSYLQLFGGATTYSGYAQQAGIPVLGNTSTTLTAAIRTDAVSGSARVVATESGGTATTLATVTGTSAWTVYSTTFVTQPATSSITVRLQVTGSGRASFDDISLAVTPTVALTLSATSVDFGAVDPLSSPFTRSPALTATVSSNTNWALSLQGAGAFSDGTGKTFPLAQLGWRLNGGSTFTAVTTAAQTVTTGTATAAAGTPNPIDYQLQVTYPDPVSAQPFSTTLTYIATTP
jgi:hypothetical protein